MADLNVLNHKLELTGSPHVRGSVTTSRSMIAVIIALLPALIAGCIVFGVIQLAVVGVAVIFAVLTEWAIKKIRKKPVTLNDFSAVLTGLLLGLIIPPYNPMMDRPGYIFVMAALGAIFAIAVGKEVFGGLGYNIFNPALVGRAFLHISFGDFMGGAAYPKLTEATETVTGATPLADFKTLIADSAAGIDAPGLTQMFMGNVSGSIGETSALAILAGGVFLVAIGLVNWRIPVSMILGMLVFFGIFRLAGVASDISPLDQVMAGGFLFAAIFMATDWVTSPVTHKGMWIYGLFISLVIVLIRIFSKMPEGVMFAILFVNAFVPLINKYTRPKLFGEGYKYE